jgi:phospholipid-binding lipoprotein MlaA
MVMPLTWRVASGLGALAVAAFAGGCASIPQLPSPSYLAKDAQPATKPADDQEPADPLEPMNRKVQDFNSSVNHGLVYPIAKAYRDTIPEPARDRIAAFTTNLSEPMTFANNVMQLRPDAALTTLARFLTNSTVGIGGLFDVAETVGQKKQSGDFGQTLYVWGVQESPYLVLPVLGPSNLRDAFAGGVEVLGPAHVLAVMPNKLAIFVESVNTVDTYVKPVAGLGKVEMMEELEASSLDFYSMLRSMSQQKREAELRQGRDESLFYWQPPGSAGTLAAATNAAAILDAPPPASEMRPLKPRVVIGEPKIE